jgi:hypothetical protein
MEYAYKSHLQYIADLWSEILVFAVNHHISVYCLVGDSVEFLRVYVLIC